MAVSSLKTKKRQNSKKRGRRKNRLQRPNKKKRKTSNIPNASLHNNKKGRLDGFGNFPGGGKGLFRTSLGASREKKKAFEGVTSLKRKRVGSCRTAKEKKEGPVRGRRWRRAEKKKKGKRVFMRAAVEEYPRAGLREKKRKNPPRGKKTGPLPISRRKEK